MKMNIFIVMPQKTTLLFILLLSVISLELSAQFGWVKNKSLGPGRIWDVVQEPDGGLTIVGDFWIQSQQPDRPNVNCHPDGDKSMIWLARLDSNWNIEWEQCYGGSRTDGPVRLIKQNDSTYLIPFWTDSEDGDMSGNTRNRECGVLVVDEMGSLDTVHFYGGNAADGLFSAIATGDGGLILGCSSTSDDGDVPGHYGPVGGFHDDAWIVKLDSELNIEWSLWWGGSGYDVGTRVLELESGEYMVALWSSSEDYDLAGNVSMAGDIWLLKLGTTGNLLWQKKIAEGPNTDHAEDIIQDSEGNILVVGMRNEYYCDSVGRDADMWAAKLDTAGNLIWDRCYGDKRGEDRVHSILENDFGYIINSIVYDAGNDVSNVYGFLDHWLAQIDSDGKILWEKNVGGTLVDNVLGLESAGDHIIGYGNSESSDYDLSGIGDTSLAYTSWLFQLELFPVGLEKKKLLSSSSFISVSPNPAHNRLYVHLPRSDNHSIYKVEVYNVQGEIGAYDSISFSSIHGFDISALNTGLYLLLLRDDNGIVKYHSTFVKNKP